MSNKATILAKVVNQSTYVGSFVKQLINEVTCEDVNIPTKLKKGDIIVVTSGAKIRPSCIIKITKEYVVSIPFTSGENVNSLCKSSSRFFKDGWFCNNYVITPIELAFQNYRGIYDNNKLLNNAIKELRLFIVKNV